MLTFCLILASWFWPLTVATVAAMVADVELTQRCLRAGTCREGNFLVPTDRRRIYAIQVPLVVGASYLGHRWRKSGRRYWWVPQVAIAAGHGVGVGVGLRFIW